MRSSNNLVRGTNIQMNGERNKHQQKINTYKRMETRKIRGINYLLNKVEEKI